MYPWFSGTLSFLLFFILLPFCVSQGIPLSSTDALFQGSCGTTTISNAWWKPLETNGDDPCQLAQYLESHFNFGCCSEHSAFPSRIRNRHHDHSCECNLQTYNIAVACITCKSSTNVTSSETIQAQIANETIRVPTLQQWEGIDPSPPGNSDFKDLQLPPWTSVPDVNGIFNVTAVVQNASLSPTPTSSPGLVMLPTSQLPIAQATSVSSDAPANPSMTAADMGVSGLPPSRTKAGVIAGGVLGGTISLALIALAVVYVIRRRRRMRIPPSAEFMPVVPAGSGYMTSQDQFSPPFPPSAWRGHALEKALTASTMEHDFTPGMWRYPILEKVPTRSTTEHEFAPGTLSKVRTWDNDSEKF